jgi:hypothetical protein
MQYLLSPGATMPAVTIHRVHFPLFEGKEARLSGAATVNDTLLLLSASIEDTPNWITDGPILGSYMALYSLKSHALLACHLLKDQQGAVAKEKIESVDLIHWQDRGITCIAVCDNDNGSSRVYRLQLRTP